jgi:hypothetical protein
MPGVLLLLQNARWLKKFFLQVLSCGQKPFQYIGRVEPR